MLDVEVGYSMKPPKHLPKQEHIQLQTSPQEQELPQPQALQLHSHLHNQHDHQHHQPLLHHQQAYQNYLPQQPQPQHHSPPQQPAPPPNSNSQAPLSHHLSSQVYPDITTLIKNNPDIIPPTVESTFVDPKICQVCGKRSNDMSRHMRIHDKNPRFRCKFPTSWCNYKSINYKRRYEFKRHLLCKHFKFDDIKMDRKMTVSSVLDHTGKCPCGLHTSARLWIDNHILTDDPSMSCPLFKY